MFGGMSLFGDMRGDPFFEMDQHMRQMDAMMRSPFGMMAAADPSFQPPLQSRPALEASRGQRAELPSRPQQVMPHGNPHGGMFGMFDMMGSMRSMMPNMGMHQQMGQAQGAPNGHFYSSSSVMTYDGSGEGQPKIYQATSSTVQAPGGVKETRKSVRDSEQGIEKLAVGHHINDTSHIVQRSRDRTGNVEENQDYINLEEHEAEQFNRQWRERMGPYSRPRERSDRSLGYHSNRGGRPHERSHDRSHERYAPRSIQQPPAIEYRDRERH